MTEEETDEERGTAGSAIDAFAPGGPWGVVASLVLAAIVLVASRFRRGQRRS